MLGFNGGAAIVTGAFSGSGLNTLYLPQVKGAEVVVRYIHEGRPGKPDLAAEPAVLLSTNRPPLITGAVYSIDGGHLARY